MSAWCVGLLRVEVSAGLTSFGLPLSSAFGLPAKLSAHLPFSAPGPAFGQRRPQMETPLQRPVGLVWNIGKPAPNSCPLPLQTAVGPRLIAPMAITGITWHPVDRRRGIGAVGLNLWLRCCVPNRPLDLVVIVLVVMIVFAMIAIGVMSITRAPAVILKGCPALGMARLVGGAVLAAVQVVGADHIIIIVRPRIIAGICHHIFPAGVLPP